jgi:hypothetical protein
MTPADFHERIAFKFVDGGDGNMTAMEMLNHMLLFTADGLASSGMMVAQENGQHIFRRHAAAFANHPAHR